MSPSHSLFLASEVKAVDERLRTLSCSTFVPGCVFHSPSNTLARLG